jgi:hypothetical protein
VPSALLPAGTTRYASAYAANVDSVVSTDGWSPMLGMTKYISIPSGKTADVMVIFCGAFSVQSGGVSVRALIRDAVAAPASFIMHSNDLTSQSRCANFQKSNVTAGNPPVTIQWSVSQGINPTDASVTARNMFIIVNIH